MEVKPVLKRNYFDEKLNLDDVLLLWLPTSLTDLSVGHKYFGF